MPRAWAAGASVAVESRDLYVATPGSPSTAPGRASGVLVHRFTQYVPGSTDRAGLTAGVAAQGRRTVHCRPTGHRSCPAADRDTIGRRDHCGPGRGDRQHRPDEADGSVIRSAPAAPGLRCHWPGRAPGPRGAGHERRVARRSGHQLLHAVAKAEPSARPRPRRFGRLDLSAPPRPGSDAAADRSAGRRTVRCRRRPAHGPDAIRLGNRGRSVDQLAATLPNAEYLPVPGDHRGALMSAEFRAAALDFLHSSQAVRPAPWHHSAGHGVVSWSLRHPRQAPEPWRAGAGSRFGVADRMRRDRRERPRRGGRSGTLKRRGRRQCPAPDALPDGLP